jgi:hypothetical protein
MGAGVRTISPVEVLRGLGIESVIVSGDGSRTDPYAVYDIYKDRDTAERVCNDLNRRYERYGYHVMDVDYGMGDGRRGHGTQAQ